MKISKVHKVSRAGVGFHFENATITTADFILFQARRYVWGWYGEMRNGPDIAYTQYGPIKNGDI